MKKKVLLSLLLLVSVSLLTAASAISATTASSLKLSESYTQKNDCFLLWGSDFCDVLTDAGKFSVTVTAPLAGIDISKFNKETNFTLAIAFFSFTAALGDDWLYTPGKTSFNVTYTSSDEWTGKKIKYMTVKLKWDTKKLTMTVTGLTPDALDPIRADMYLWDGTYKFTDSMTAYIEMGDDLYSGFNVNYSGTTKTTTKTNKKNGNSYGTAVVKLAGKGVPTSEDFREEIPEETE